MFRLDEALANIAIMSRDGGPTLSLKIKRLHLPPTHGYRAVFVGNYFFSNFEDTKVPREQIATNDLADKPLRPSASPFNREELC